VAPRGEAVITVPLPAIPREAGAEYFLNLSFTLNDDTRWARKGHEVAWEQWPIGGDGARAPLSPRRGRRRGPR